MNHLDRVQAVLNGADPGRDLRILVSELSAEGMAKSEIYQLLEKSMVCLRKAGSAPEKQFDALLDVLDALAGWCHSSAHLLPDETLAAD